MMKWKKKGQLEQMLCPWVVSKGTNLPGHGTRGQPQTACLSMSSLMRRVGGGKGEMQLRYKLRTAVRAREVCACFFLFAQGR